MDNLLNGYPSCGRKTTYTSACGKRTLHPYTTPFLTPFTSVRISWYFGSRTMRSRAVCLHERLSASGARMRVYVGTAPGTTCVDTQGTACGCASFAAMSNVLRGLADGPCRRAMWGIDLKRNVRIGTGSIRVRFVRWLRQNTSGGRSPADCANEPRSSQTRSLR